MIDRKKFDRAKRFLRRKYPIDATIRIVFVPHSKLKAEWKSNMYGDFFYDGDSSYTIRISDDLSTKQAILTLLHEWCHVLQTAHSLPQTSDHDRLFRALESALIKEFSAFS